jgi:SAM-dependent methyltransferase
MKSLVARSMSNVAFTAARALAARPGRSRALTPTGVDGPLLRLWSIAWTRANLRRHRMKSNRRLEIGPGSRRLDDFETLNCMFGRHIDYVWDAARPLPFPSGTFTLIYASHVLEHFAWYQTADILREWTRVLAPGGALEVWVPDGLKICQAFVDAETQGLDPLEADPWTRFNDGRDPCVWASGRVFTYGDGRGTLNDPNWHRALFSARYLQALMAKAGLVAIEVLDRREVRGYDHGWINLGMRGRKPGV